MIARATASARAPARTGAHAIHRGLQRFGFLRDAPPQIHCELRRRLACHERFDAAIYELTHLARVIQRIAARMTFRGVREQLWLAVAAKLAERGVGHPTGVFLTRHCKLSANFFRARNSRDFTVPSGRPASFATSRVL